MAIPAPIKDFWDSRSAAQKRLIVVCGVILGVLIVTYGIVNSFNKQPKNHHGKKAQKYELLTGRESQALSPEVNATALADIKKRLDRFEDQAATKPKSGQTAAAGDGMTDDAISSLMEDPTLTEEDRASLREIKTRRSNGAGYTGAGDSQDGRERQIRQKPGSQAKQQRDTPIKVEQSDAPPPAMTPQLQKATIRTFNSMSGNKQQQTQGNRTGGTFSGGETPDGTPAPEGEGAQTYKQKSKNINDPNQLILPAGSIITGTLVTGMDAPSASSAKREPFPSLLRIKSEAILPNRFRMDIKECFLIASGYGDLSSERAILRGESISCVRDDGAVLEASIDAYASGEDGKVGVRGRLVSREGALIAKAMMGGFIAGIANLAKPAKIPALSLSNSGTIETERYNVSTIAEESTLSGVSNAASEIAKYYIDMAKNMFPVIEVDAGRRVDFIVQKGAHALTPRGGQGISGIASNLLNKKTKGNLTNGDSSGVSGLLR